MRVFSRLLAWLTAVWTAAVLFLPAWQCVQIYWAGSDAGSTPLTDIFTRDAVFQKLESLAPLFYGYVLLVIIAFAVQALSPDHPRPVPLTAENRLRLVKAQRQDLPQEALKEEKHRRVICAAAGAAIFACSIPACTYLLNRSSFASPDLEQVMGQMVLHLMPPVVCAFAAAFLASLLRKRSMERECAILRDLPAGTAVPVLPEKAGQAGHSPLLSIFHITLLLLGVLFIVLGVMNGGMRDVLVKAIQICTECIGLG